MGTESKGEAGAAVKRRTANLRRSRTTVVTGLAHGDRVSASFDAENWEWRLIVESSNGVKIEHLRLTDPPNLA